MLLKDLSEAIGLSGNEDAIRELIIPAIEAHVDSWRVDTMGNLIAFKKGTGASPLKVMIAAHMDEVGFVVTGHDSNGYLLVENMGGIDAKILPALRVKVGKKKLAGVFTWKPIHLNTSQEIVSIDHLRVDIGTSTKEAAQSAAPIGTYIGFDSPFIHLSESVVRGKALDDRAGCAELVEICQGEAFPFDLYAVFTVQEEVGLRGAKVVSASIQPDYAVILEATACHETPQDPEQPNQTTVTKMGMGPALSYMDATSISHPLLLKHFIATAEAENIPYQFRSAQFAGGNDAGSIHLSGPGVPTVAVSLPCRYLHSPNSLISLIDYENALKLVRAALHRLPPTLER